MEFSKCFDILQSRRTSAGTESASSPSLHSCGCEATLSALSPSSSESKVLVTMDLEQFQNKTIFELITIFQRLQEERVIVRLTPHFLSLSLSSASLLTLTLSFLADLSTI
jgi:hypothetical protein